jgi:hypothetical protein
VKKAEHCIVYMHGMDSNILEGSMLIPHLPNNFALCCFDFAGSGKSQGSCSTYGIKEFRDIGTLFPRKKASSLSSRGKAMTNLYSGDDRWEPSPVWLIHQRTLFTTTAFCKSWIRLSVTSNQSASSGLELTTISQNSWSNTQ